ncbi:MAG: HAMP domain-containing histidine kinase [Clostridiales bacterium]|jgi:signal transduction histidine kinase|nr:HAMP domain-containing histidine kinase [Clostridiales bacterium]
MKRRLRIGTKISIMYGGMIAVLLVLGSVILFIYITNTNAQRLKRTMEMSVSQMKDYIEAGGRISRSAVERVSPNRFISMAVAEVLEGVPVREGATFPFNPEDFKDAFRPGASMVTINNVRYMASEKNAVFNSRIYMIRAYSNYEREIESTKILVIILGFVNIVGVVVAVFIGRIMSKVTLNPISRMIQTAQRIGAEDLSERIEVSDPDDELKQLALAFNDMLKRLEVSFCQQAQFVADASHELRTPIAVINGYANLLNRWGKDDPAVLQESLDCIIAQTEHMSNMAKKMLLLAKEEQAAVQHLPINLSEIANTVVKEMELFKNKWNVQLNFSGRCMILGDYDMVKQLVWILMDNAVKYSLSYEAGIEIDIFDKDDSICLAIKDHGIGISNEDLPYIFQRFYRADRARTSTNRGGIGLGLSIASRIIKQHHAKVIVDSIPQVGTQIYIYFQIPGGIDYDDHESIKKDDGCEPGGDYARSADDSDG